MITIFCFPSQLGSNLKGKNLPGLPQSGKNIWKMKFFPGQGKVREFCGWSEKFRKDLESQGKIREFESKWLLQADIRKFILFFSRGEI